MTLREITPGTPDYDQALRLRDAVLRVPLGLRLTNDDLADDPHCIHFGGFEDTRLVAVLLLHPVDAHTVKMRQVAVHPASQGRGLGVQLVAFAERVAKERGFTRMIAHARGTAIGFYVKAGYTAVGADFLETTIPHRLVTKDL